MKTENPEKHWHEIIFCRIKVTNPTTMPADEIKIGYTMELARSRRSGDDAARTKRVRQNSTHASDINNVVTDVVSNASGVLVNIFFQAIVPPSP